MSLPTVFFQPEFKMSSFLLGIAVGMTILATYIAEFEEPAKPREPFIIKCIKEYKKEIQK
jgi:hypothetical protein